ncbi:MAG: 1-acyl-sn-glycerol-3-phosphate acyltransferase, partial [Alphaproteobacteria bacterium]|nr:1-acyl-sn-glycerol-3-phosphate acyltransferase [Alphaproteobacteria bacterium]
QPVIIFPEGTRSAPGKTGTYHPGVAALYKGLNVPVAPVALNSGLFWQRNGFLKRPGRITIEILPPIAAGLDRKVFMAELKSRIEDSSNRLAIEARAAHPAALPVGVDDGNDNGDAEGADA